LKPNLWNSEIQMSYTKKGYYVFMFAISVILLVGGTIFLINSAFTVSERENWGFMIGFVLVFTGFGVFLYDIFLQQYFKSSHYKMAPFSLIK
jgi:4-amino-4-deoxy-L-arabinose transferase-like glycosyltransferase